MTKSIQQAISAATLRILRQLARVMLNHGIAYGVFAELARKAFVEEGYLHLEKSRQRQTVSGVSALTGLTRKETKRLREQSPDENPDSGHRYHRAIRVISGWINDPLFQDDKGEPAVLPLEGDQGSFSALVKAYSGDIPVAAMLSLLEHSDNVEQAEGRIKLIERAYLPMNTPVDKIDILGTDVAELLATINHNLLAPPGDRFFQRKVSNILVRSEAVDEFRRLSNRKSQELLEEYHQWLSANEVDIAKDPDANKTYVAVGIYYTEHAGQEDEK